MKIKLRKVFKKNTLLKESFSRDVVERGKEPRLGSLPTPSWLPDLLGLEQNQDISPTELANDSGLSHLPPTGLSVNKGSLAT